MFWVRLWNKMIIVSACMTTEFKTYDETQVDYSEYLGKDYKKTQKLPKNVSMIVCNHQSWIDNMVLLASPLQPGMVAKVETKKVLFLGTIIK